jgi:hypothetical protein
MTQAEFLPWYERMAGSIFFLRKALAKQNAAAKRRAEEEAERQRLLLLSREEEAEIEVLSKRAKKKWLQLDVDGSGKLEGQEVMTLAEWVWGNFHPGEEMDAEVRCRWQESHPHPGPNGRFDCKRRAKF